jgi:hypothetical protein
MANFKDGEILHILNMPHEILIKIFSFFKVEPESRHAPAQDIPNCRLTCRLFCGLSSEFLISAVLVDHRPSSLLRLDEICSHPTISKGV